MRRARTVPAAALASAALALAAGAALPSASDLAQERAVIAVATDPALPGEGRPPSPGPTNPDGGAY